MNNIFDDEKDRFNEENDALKSTDGAASYPTAQPPQPAAQMPQLQLTPEQIQALLNQLVIVQQQTPPQQPPAPQQIAAGENGAPNPGKRILFQSADFDDPGDSTRETPDNLLAEKFSEEKRKKTFYDDDELFDNESAGRLGLAKAQRAFSPVKTTDFGSDFSVSEIELSEDSFPSLQQRHTVTEKRPAAIAQTSSAKKDFAKEIEEETLPSFRPVPKAPVQKSTKPTVAFKAPEVALKTKLSENVEVEEIESGEGVQTEKEKKKLSVSEIIRRCVLIVSLAAILIASGVLIREYKLHKDNEKLESEISDLIITEPETAAADETEETDENDETKEAEKQISTEEQWEELRKEYPDVIFPPGLPLKYAKLYAINHEFVGYLSADGIGMSLPIVQTSDDEKYLTKNFYGQTTKYGCPFVTHLNNIVSLDMNTVIFGHHMNDGTVFGVLDNYKTIEGFRKAPVITFNTINGDYQWKVIAAFITNANPKDDNGYEFQYYFTSLSTTERFSAFLNELAQRSLYDTGVDVLPTDKLLTLSTCSHEFDDARFVVVARLVRAGESADVNTENAVVNSSPRYPQAYYTKKKLDNPYKNAERWYVG